MLEKTGALRLAPLLHTLHYLTTRSGRSYCWPSQEAILSLLERYHNIKICRRTLNYWLASAEEAGYIRRIRRIKRLATGELVFRSTIYELKKKGKCWIRRVAGWLGIKTSSPRVPKRPYEPPPRWAGVDAPCPSAIGPPIEMDAAKARILFAALAAKFG